MFPGELPEDARFVTVPAFPRNTVPPAIDPP